MRKPDTIEWLYLDFDGFFASVEQQARPGPVSYTHLTLPTILRV